MEDATCSIPDCDKPTYVKGLCSKHYNADLQQRRADAGEDCSVEGCDKVARTKGLCNAHHLRALKYGDPEGAQVKISLRDRLQAKIRVLPNGCWEWTGAPNDNGYGTLVTGSKTDGTRRMRRAHIVVYEEFVGPVPEGFDLDHVCHNEDLGCPGGSTCPHRRCVNPEHLRVATRQENLLAGRTLPAANAAKTHCPRGHEFTPENTLWNDGKRRCRICNAEWFRDFRAAKKGERR